ncbi:hypothetical protein GCM10010507_11270 [Streptomyces cinnamoneus]|uniref:Uncharacterized protein n=1 Tax=Streptomyces cinnamoneus TaxID=53446 RepID=A0A918TBW8_STRCJ|nr:hypothetical protein GCM10010507_11270 [Streptomyces cinnamoneus]
MTCTDRPPPVRSKVPQSGPSHTTSFSQRPNVAVRAGRTMRWTTSGAGGAPPISLLTAAFPARGCNAATALRGDGDSVAADRRDGPGECSPK